MIVQSAASHPPGTVALADSRQHVLYGELGKEVSKRAALLQDVKILGLALDNSVEWVLWDLAALQAGIPCVPFPPFFTREQLDHVIRTAGISHILSPGGLAGTGVDTGIGLPQGTAKVTFTSGTTATPKGVCLSEKAMERVASSLVEAVGDDVRGIHASVLPLSVLLENVAGVYAGLMAGCTIHLSNTGQPGPTMEALRDRLHSLAANSIILVPEYLRVLLGQVKSQGPLPELKYVAVGGAKVSSSLIGQAREAGLPVYEGYGLSECASVVSLNTPRQDKPGSVGKLLPHVEAVVVNGEVLVEEPGFLGYIGAAPPMVFSTGDLGFMDRDGFLHITGRKKHVLITSYGRNISPEWVEAALLAQPGIYQAVVYGDAMPYPGALIVPDNSGTDIQDAVNRANANLPGYAHVHEFHVMPPFTVEDNLLTGTARVRREAVLERYLVSEGRVKTDDVLRVACQGN